MRLEGKHVFHVSQENLDADFAAMWKWLCVDNPPATVTEHEELTSDLATARHADTVLTDAGREAITNHLSRENYFLSVVDALSENSLSSAMGATRE